MISAVLMYTQEVEGQVPALAAMVVGAPVLPDQVVDHPPPQVEPLAPAVEEHPWTPPAATTIDDRVPMDRCYTWFLTALVEVAVIDPMDMMPLDVLSDDED